MDELKKGAIQVTPVVPQRRRTTSAACGAELEVWPPTLRPRFLVVKDEHDEAKTGADAAPSSTAIARDQDATDSRELADRNKTLAAELQQQRCFVRRLWRVRCLSVSGPRRR